MAASLALCGCTGGEQGKPGGDCGPIRGCSTPHEAINAMGNKIFTEADRKATPRPTPVNGAVLPSHGRGQRSSLERGVATRSKKNPGKRTHKGG